MVKSDSYEVLEDVRVRRKSQTRVRAGEGGTRAVGNASEPDFTHWSNVKEKKCVYLSRLRD